MFKPFSVMKKIILLSLLFLDFNFGFAQYGNPMYMNDNDITGIAPVAIDTSEYPFIRNKIKDQSFFIKLDSNNLDAYIKRSMLKFQMNDFAGSIKDYNKIILRMPNSTEAYSNRGMAYCMLKNYTASLSDMNKALILTPDAMSYKLRAVVKQYTKDFNGAISDLDTALFMHPDYAEGYCCRAGTLVKMKKYKEAVEDYTKAIFRDPQNWLYYCGRSEAKFYLEDYKGVIDDSNKVLELNSTLNEYHFFEDLAVSYEKIGDKANAKLNKEKAAVIKKTANY